MVTNYYTLQALVREWASELLGCTVSDVFSQERDELSLALEGQEHSWMIRLSTRSAFHFAFRTTGYSKARRNVATLFEEAVGRRVTAVRLAERDRMLYVDLEGGGGFRAMLFGPRANVFLTGADERVREAFAADADWEGEPAPAPRPAARVEDLAAFEARWRGDRRRLDQAVAGALPLFDRTLAAEVVHRAGVGAGPADCTAEERRALFEAACALREELERPAPRIYWQGRFAETLALVPLRHLAHLEEEPFETVDHAVGVFVRRTLGQERFRARYEPLAKALGEAAAHHRRSAERMLDELSQPSRADRYEAWGHLLMASPADVPAGADEVVLPDLFGGGEPVAIPLDPARSAIENAQRCYDKARRTRQARLHAEDRIVAAEEKAREAERLLGALQAAADVKALDQFVREEGPRLAPYRKGGEGGEDRVPFRQYALPGGYEVWVGRNARQNDLLTFRYARKYDLWMHARGVAGSHAVLRLPNRHAVPGRNILQQAASIAAYHSKAQGSSLVPVMVTERKYVRKPRGGAPGAVLVQREDVLLVEPGVPD